MKNKFLIVSQLHVGCLGRLTYYENNKFAEWNKNVNCPYVVFRKRVSDSLDNCHEGKDVFSGESYYFLDEVSGRKSTLEIVYGKQIVGKSIPLSVVCGSEKKSISFSELKSILCHFNITDALIKRRDDINLLILQKHLNDIDLMDEGKVKEYYIDKIATLINSYIDYSLNSDEKDDKLLEEIEIIQSKLAKEKELPLKKIKKIK